jgi:hypothetical protein
MLDSSGKTGGCKGRIFNELRGMIRLFLLWDLLCAYFCMKAGLQVDARLLKKCRDRIIIKCKE